ncbi:LamG-like jellyroll fold domain-containing protein [Luteolibacter sp. Populi]|uniref:LamG-like jellyroll fold domain-containing protein n=1 Tax=Luteolibacter sp. Populi TaxID=3230487 RepID=UPI0034651E70
MTYLPLRSRLPSLPALLALGLALPLHAATVTLSATDAPGSSSFNAAGNWNPASAPSAGNDYVVPIQRLRTPTPVDPDPLVTGYTFAGNSLTLSTAAGNLTFKTNASYIITVPNLILAGGLIDHLNAGTQTFTLAGNLTVTGTGSRISATQGPINVTAPIAGSGDLTIIANLGTTFSAANTFTGNLTVNGAFTLADTGSLVFDIGASGVNNSVGGTGPAAFNGSFTIDLTDAGNTVGNSWTLVNAGTLTETFGPTFNIPGFTENENIWTSASGIYQFIEATGVLTRISPDSDGDGLPDAWEYANFGAGNLSESATGDFDLDFATNLLEYQSGTNPANPASFPDADDDGLNDGWELFYFNNSLAQTPDGDPDGDFNTNAAEYAAETDPGFAGSYPDTDDGLGDGLNDGWEVHYFGSIAAGIPGADPDGDLFSNSDEFSAGTDPIVQLSSPDGDGDGLADGWEVHHFGEPGEALEVVTGKQAAAGDPDADGYDNAAEFSLGTDPTDSASVPGPVAWWRFDELTTGPLPAGAGGEAEFNNVVLDASGNANHMRTYNGQTAPEYSTDVPFATVPQGGQTNAASLYFDGGTDGSWLDVIYTDPGAPVRSMQFSAWTIEASFKMDAPALDHDQVVFAKDGNPLGGQPPFHMKYHSSDQKFEVGMIDGSGTACYVSSAATISAGQWYSVAATASATELKLWIKGPGDSAYGLAGTTPISGAFFNTFAGLNDAWGAGRFRWNGTETDVFKGYIDEIRISAGVLPTAGFMASTTFGDTDLDGMDDNWEMANFDESLGQTAAGDFDSDGTANFVEFLLGLDPGNGASTFAVSRSGSTLTWPAAAGLTFVVQRSTTLASWDDVATVTGSGSWTDPSPPDHEAFYRVVLDTD